MKRQIFFFRDFWFSCFRDKVFLLRAADGSVSAKPMRLLAMGLVAFLGGLVIYSYTSPPAVPSGRAVK
jgi:hypothetical protein